MAGILDALFTGNPFQRAAGADPWEGMRAVGQSPAQAPQPVQQQPTSQMPAQRAYSPLTDPNGPLARAGWIGALMAQGPTRQEMLLQQSGQGQQAAVAGIGQRIQAGMPPQRALIDFANSPEGQEFFVSGGGFSDLANIVKGVSPAPLPDPMNIAPGGAIFQPNGVGGGSMIAQNPVGEVQKFKAMTEFANMTKDEIEQTARAQLAQDLTGNPTEGEAARDALVRAGRMSQETSNLIGAGVLKVQPILDQSGATIGHAIVNIVDGTTTMLQPSSTAPGQLPQPGSKDYAPGVTPTTETQNNGPTFQGMANPADIVDSAGPVGWVLDRLAPIAGNAFPAMDPIGTTRNRRALEAIMTDANRIAKSGKVLKTEMDDLRNLADTLKFNTSPATATQTLLSLHDRYDNMDEVLNGLANDPKQTAQVRGDAIIDISLLKQARANMPTREQLSAKQTQLKAREPLETIQQQLTESGETLEKSGVVEGEKPEAQPGGAAYTDIQTLRKDWEDGKLKKGDTVTLNGKKYPITRDFK